MKERIINLDLVRIVAIILVFCEHFFYMSGFTYSNFYGLSTLIILPFFWLAHACIGIWVILSGYLCGKNKFNKKYLFKLCKILLGYVFTSIIIILFSNLVNNSNISIGDAISQILSFKVNSYVWYVEMYIGLFLLIPFLNILYNKLKKKERQILLIILLIISSLTSTLYFFIPLKFSTSLFSDYWTVTFPIMFYFVGRYLKDYPLKISNLKKLSYILIILLIQTILSYVIYHGNGFPVEFKVGQAGGFYNLFTVFIAILIFSFVKDIKKVRCERVVNVIATSTFEMYLISNLFDNLFYGHLHSVTVSSLGTYFIDFLLAISFVFICSFIIGFIINKLNNYFCKKIYVIYDKINLKI